MNTEVVELPVIEKTSLKKEKRVDKQTMELLNRLTEEKKFGIADLWNIRKKGRSFSIYSRSI